ncbi:hypothetical protein L228DRAFT_267631 [Xylona heveae TC161]|uniref:Zn(2)-C6 fungal-type domain-containing protein n=1 Tax=Xylona heveae (strain CBS 132557 / TC161) TaxID=1328760 RepID=A0A165HKK6_XYLHT|nr:hypothetical protein L228DRAFT_267631 [Xylona heveae TC161]KZF23652.1 hypothetical protein L228DRAFT_267631 [Xylona heveae TC161]
MPGILPMKVIKVGTSSQSRIAQACDRCRSKKIRCDGIRPCCSQCASVGFECKTSDKLSRRAFPRGYTESLEERVRSLETEIREMKDLLDEKDEKIDMLSRIRSPSARLPPQQPSPVIPTTTASPPISTAEKDSDAHTDGDTFWVHQPSPLCEDEERDPYFAGLSAGRTLVESFKREARQTGKLSMDFNSSALFDESSPISVRTEGSESISTSKAPPRLVSDQLVNVFFQEWAPLFPVLHRPTFLALYESYVANPDAVLDKHSIAQLHLVFGIAALSSESRSELYDTSFEEQWQTAVDSISRQRTLATLQCLTLAQLFCMAKGDYESLLHYKGLAIGLSQRLGLHQSHERFSSNALVSETRKRLFWALYTIDCFSSAVTGLPRMMREEDIQAEYPCDVDDEYITEKGFQPTLPGEFTKISSALELFKASRILAKVLKEIYPSSASHELSLQKLHQLADELAGWSNSMPSHLKLLFVKDKPSTNVISSRSPLLSLAYYYIRSLIYLPAIGSSELGAKASSSVIALGDAGKHLIQILQLLEERRLSFSFCLNKRHLLVLSGFGLLYQDIVSKSERKPRKDSQKLASWVVEVLARGSPSAASAFEKASSSVRPARDQPKIKGTSRRNSDPNMPASHSISTSTPKSAQVAQPRMVSGNGLCSQEEANRRATIANLSVADFAQSRSQSQVSLSSINSEPVLHSAVHRSPSYSAASTRSTAPMESPNLDFLAFQAEPVTDPRQAPRKLGLSTSEWEQLLGSIDNGQANIYDNIYGGPPVDGIVDANIPASTGVESYPGWSSEFWGMWDSSCPPAAQSVLSFSEESLTSGEELSHCDPGSVGASGPDACPGILIPADGAGEGFGFEGLEETLRV